MAQNYTFFSEPPKEIPFIRRSAETEDGNKTNAVRRGHQMKMCPYPHILLNIKRKRKFCLKLTTDYSRGILRRGQGTQQ